MLSPILNAHHPDKFTIINTKSLTAVELFSGGLYTADLPSYPLANAGTKEVLAAYEDILEVAFELDLYPSELFDLFSHWISINKEKVKHAFGKGSAGVDAVFTDKTFELLEELAQTPLMEWYEQHRPEFDKHVIQPLQSLLRDVIEQIPPEMREVLETEKNLFSRIPKYDYGQGGAHAEYWGALYPKGKKRIEDAQLFVYLNKERFEFGFYFGHNTSEDALARFEQRCKEYQPLLEEAVDAVLTDPNFPSSESNEEEESTAFDATTWLDAPADFSYGLRLQLSPETAQIYSLEDLVRYITRTFQSLYPLVLLTLPDDPAIALEAFYGDKFKKRVVPLPTLYALEQLAEDTLMAPGEVQRWTAAIQRKGQIIFYGSPGTGKTFLARCLARHLVSGGDGFWELMQFHPSYAYEDFMEGIRPRSLSSQDTNGDEGTVTDSTGASPTNGFTYEMVPGRFLEFCKEAGKRKGLCVLIIDEINRAELSRVFGELMYLLEYRSLSNASANSDAVEIPLAGGTKFKIPSNVRLIGTMNTADRSIALVDHALRRRFAFIPVNPDYALLAGYHAKHNPSFPVDELTTWLKAVNTAIGDPHYSLGVSFFLTKNLSDHIADIWQMEIEPYLEEYFFDKRDKAKEFAWHKGPLARLLDGERNGSFSRDGASDETVTDQAFVSVEDLSGSQDATTAESAGNSDG